MYPAISDIHAPYNARREEWVNDDDQNVSEIIEAIKKRHSLDHRDYDGFSKQFWKGNAKDTAKNLFDFCKKNISYIIESENDQTVKTPGRIIADRYGDCKHFALFINGVCQSLSRKGLPIASCFRFVSDYPDKEVHHVFAVVRDDIIDYWVDPVIDRFNERPKFHNIKDVVMSVSSLSGTYTQDIAQVGKHRPMWQAFVNPFHSQMEIMTWLKSHGKHPGNFKNKHELHNFILHNHPAGQAHLRAHSAATAQPIQVHGVGKKKSKPGHDNFLKKLGKGIEKGEKKAKQLSLKVSLSAGRGSFLSLVDINAFNLAHRLHDALLGAKRAALLHKWEQMGGNPKMLINAVNNGYRQYKQHHSGYVIARDKISGELCVVAGIGVVQVAALMALASAFIAALSKFLDKNPKEDKEMADAAKEGVEKITANTIQSQELSDTPAGDKALKDMTSSAANGIIKASTGVAADGTPEITVHDVQHPLLNKAGLMAAPEDQDTPAGSIIPGGGNVPGANMAKFDIGGNLNGFFNTIKAFIIEHKGPIIAITIGTIAITKGPGIIKSLSKKKRR